MTGPEHYAERLTRLERLAKMLFEIAHNNQHQVAAVARAAFMPGMDGPCPLCGEPLPGLPGEVSVAGVS